MFLPLPLDLHLICMACCVVVFTNIQPWAASWHNDIMSEFLVVAGACEHDLNRRPDWQGDVCQSDGAITRKNKQAVQAIA